MTPEVMSVGIALFIAIIFITFLTKKGTIKLKKQPPSLVNSFASFFEGNEMKALEELKHIAIDKTTNPEIFLAIGFIYRKNKEYAKAAQVHELLFGNHNIDDEFRKSLIGELAKDYMLAGLPVRAITLFKENDSVINREENLVTMAWCQLAVQNYDNAIAYHVKYNKATGKHLYGFFAKCMIEKALYADKSNALKYIKSALEENKLCRPARMIKAVLLLDANKLNKAIEEFTSILKDGLLRDENDFKQVEKAFIAKGQETELTNILQDCVNAGNINPFIHIALAKHYIYLEEKEQAAALMESYIELPDAKVIGAKYYVELTGNKMIKHIVQDISSYKCHICGYETNEYKDDCPNCKSYDSIIPK